jgi:hypothetical protein
MSHLNAMKTQMSDREMLVRALCRHMHLNRNQIEVHDKAQPIIGYHGNEDQVVGNVIIRKGKSGIPSDIGWEQKDGAFTGHVDSFDYTQNSSWNSKIILDDNWNLGLQDAYNREVLVQGLKDKGKEFTETVDKDGYPLFIIKAEAQSFGIQL